MIEVFILIKGWNHEDYQRCIDGDEGIENKHTLQIDWEHSCRKSYSHHSGRVQH